MDTYYFGGCWENGESEVRTEDKIRQQTLGVGRIRPIDSGILCNLRWTTDERLIYLLPCILVIVAMKRRLYCLHLYTTRIRRKYLERTYRE
jgi:hypothetical protein